MRVRHREAAAVSTQKYVHLARTSVIASYASGGSACMENWWAVHVDNRSQSQTPADKECGRCTSYLFEAQDSRSTCVHPASTRRRILLHHGDC
ncbi:hypothetical protein BDV09DRAFT_122385 [Aspergillus tetrazonus]